MSWRRFGMTGGSWSSSIQGLFGSANNAQTNRTRSTRRRDGGGAEGGDCGPPSRNGKATRRSKRKRTSTRVNYGDDSSHVDKPKKRRARTTTRTSRRTRSDRKKDDSSSSSGRGKKKKQVNGIAKKRKIKGILKTPGSPGRKKKRRLVFSPKLEEFGETYSKSEYDRSMLEALQIVCDYCMQPLMGQPRYTCPVKSCDYDFCIPCHSSKAVKEHRKMFHPNRSTLRFKKMNFEDWEN
eukprot:CAMPEP_0197518356 /NCGR_PEP_ID=MMETSP1318-20131121/3531_1 /TAXON_ID=552666 /ORGANISM="Partenskyella glossopodia, Strain RCC365" /LENGTH=236 /DNA_ID=CAMNT_0043068635 /DNA_START=42 /DNA_END=752 /DNA_ORIENTATION=+